MSERLLLPDVVSEEDWSIARGQLLAREKQLTKELDILAARRRRMPMVRIESEYRLQGPDGELGLIDLFEGRRQLLVYHFMFGPDWEEGCEGCSLVVDNFGHVAHLNARDTTLALVSRAPLPKLQAFRERMGWTLPWYSSAESDFNFDFGVSGRDGGESFGLSVFVRDDDGGIYRSYFVNRRGIELMTSNWALLDLTPLGRQEEWEDTPPGRPQVPVFEWARLHDSYDSDGN